LGRRPELLSLLTKPPPAKLVAELLAGTCSITQRLLSEISFSRRLRDRTLLNFVKLKTLRKSVAQFAERQFQISADSSNSIRRLGN